MEKFWSDSWLMSEEKFIEKTEREVTAWSIAGRTAPFIAVAGMLLIIFFAEQWITIYAVIVLTVWVIISVAWWWWALFKILRVIRLLLSAKVKFDEVKAELVSIKNDMGNRQRRKSTKD